jgi:hypothetical protein
MGGNAVAVGVAVACVFAGNIHTYICTSTRLLSTLYSIQSSGRVPGADSQERASTPDSHRPQPSVLAMASSVPYHTRTHGAFAFRPSVEHESASERAQTTSLPRYLLTCVAGRSQFPPHLRPAPTPDSGLQTVAGQPSEAGRLFWGVATYIETHASPRASAWGRLRSRCCRFLFNHTRFRPM